MYSSFYLNYIFYMRKVLLGAWLALSISTGASAQMDIKSQYSPEIYKLLETGCSRYYEILDRIEKGQNIAPSKELLNDEIDCATAEIEVYAILLRSASPQEAALIQESIQGLTNGRAFIQGMLPLYENWESERQ